MVTQRPLRGRSRRTRPFRGAGESASRAPRGPWRARQTSELAAVLHAVPRRALSSAPRGSTEGASLPDSPVESRGPSTYVVGGMALNWTPNPADPEVFHITHVDNLPSIEQVGLLSDIRVAATQTGATTIGDPSIKSRRMTWWLRLPDTRYNMTAGGQAGQQGVVHLVRPRLDAGGAGAAMRVHGRECGRPPTPPRGKISGKSRALLDWNALTATDWRDPAVASAMLEPARGNLLLANVEALVNTRQHGWGDGQGNRAAVQARAFPENFKEYARACKDSKVEVGRVFVHRTGQLQPKWILNVPTKRHWRQPSRLDDVRRGIEALARVIEELEIKSVAVPPLGCGAGGLAWSEVRPLLEEHLGGLEGGHGVVVRAGSPATGGFDAKPNVEAEHDARTCGAVGVGRLVPGRGLGRHGFDARVTKARVLHAGRR